MKKEENGYILRTEFIDFGASPQYSPCSCTVIGRYKDRLWVERDDGILKTINKGAFYETLDKVYEEIRLRTIEDKLTRLENLIDVGTKKHSFWGIFRG